MEIHSGPLTEPAAQKLLDVIAPGSRLLSIQPVEGGFSNHNFFLNACRNNGEDLRFVVKLYQEDRDFSIRLAQVEYQALRWLTAHQRPVPEPVYVDIEGDVLGGPGLVTRFMPGKPLMAPPYPEDWGKQMARTLASIHAYPCDPSTQPFLLDASPEALWFRRKGKMPDWLAADPDGPRIWQAIEDLLPTLQKVPPKLIHRDYWAGNILCLEGKIVGVLDWGEASSGDPCADVAYALMDLVLSGLDRDAAEFLAEYQAVTGEPLANLTFWKLAEAVRPVYIPAGYIDYSPVRERFRRFVQEAIDAAYSGL